MFTITSQQYVFFFYKLDDSLLFSAAIPSLDSFDFSHFKEPVFLILREKINL